MSATITSQNRRVPFGAALAVAGVIAAAGALGIVWEQSGDSTAPAQAPVLRTPTAQDYGQYNYYHGPQTQGGHGTDVPPSTTSGGRLQMVQ